MNVLIKQALHQKKKIELVNKGDKGEFDELVSKLKIQRIKTGSDHSQRQSFQDFSNSFTIDEDLDTSKDEVILNINKP